MSAPMWEYADGTWTLASHVVRSLAYAVPSELTAAELYFILTTLDAERFRWLWDNGGFLEQAAIRNDRSGFLGDNLWAAGDIDGAIRWYQEMSTSNSSRDVIAGLGGLVKLSFFIGDYATCIEAFRKGCATDFIPQSKTMCRAIVAAAARSGTLDSELQEAITNYFQFVLDVEEIDSIAASSLGNDKQLARLRRYVAPKVPATDRSLETLMAEGETERARMLCDRIPRTAEFASEAVSLLDAFLQSGDGASLDEMQAKAAPFGIRHADELVITAVIWSRGRSFGQYKLDRAAGNRVFVPSSTDNDPIRRNPPCWIALLRRFGYPSFKFLPEYIAVLQLVDVPIEAPDVVAGILAIPTYEVGFCIDKGEVYKNRSWYETMVTSSAEAFDRTQWSNEDTAIGMLIRTYKTVQERLAAVKGDARWMEEARLGAALRVLFGDDEVQRHARPVWLRQQHLDYFLPRYSLAVEYMGKQHFEPLEWLGGKEALETTQARDEQKRRLCAENGFTLLYVKHDEDVGRRAREIHAASFRSRGPVS